jgi:hypothetical protein
MTARRWYHTPFVLVFLIFVLSCEEKIADNPVSEGPPKTFLWLFPDSTVGVGVSRQDIHWWGEDPDGVVRGFLFSFGVVETDVFEPPNPDTLRYTWVTTNDSTVFFPLDTLFRKYLVSVRAVDNNFPGLPEQSVVRLIPTPFWDKNDNGVLDQDDEELLALTPAMDPKGAALTFPIRNTPPQIGFLPNPNDGSALRQPDTTFTVATFAWKGYDFDGDNTLFGYRFALNDTSADRWFTVPLRDTIVTLVVPRARSDAAGSEVNADVYGGYFLERRYLGEVKGLRLDALNVLYAQAQDVAGEYSRAIVMPSGDDHWYVRRPRGRMLVVSDYINFDAPLAFETYRSSLAALPGGAYATIDHLNIGLGLTATEKSLGTPGRLVPPFVDPALVQTFLLFDEVLWYTDQFPSLGVAQLSLFTYMQNGGRVLFSTSFQTTVDPSGALRDFAPIDSISSVDLSPTRPPVPPPVAGDTRIPANFVLVPDSTGTEEPYPQLAFNASPVIHSIFMRPVYRRSDARYIYHLQSDSRVPARYLGAPDVAVIDGARTIIFFGMPLHLLNNTDVGNPLGLTAFFARAFAEEFNPLQKVDRGRF